MYVGPLNPSGARSFAFVDANVGVLSGFSGDYLQTTDGGLNWTPMVFDMPANGVGGVNARSLGAVVSLGNGTLLGTAGNNSQRAGDNIVVKSTDGGVNWTQVSVLPGAAIKMSFADASHGVISGYDQAQGSWVLMRTTDAGLTWTTTQLNAGGFYDVKLSSDGSGVAVAADGIMYTSDFGATWHAAQGGLLPSGYPYSVGLVQPGQFVVGVVDLTIPQVNQPLILRNTQGGVGP